MNDTLNRKRLARATWILLALGMAIRIYAAWTFSNQTSQDYGRVGLMAKHMAELKHFPVFFYGSAYMGTLEPMISALFCKVGGVNGFLVCLGTSLTAFLILPLTYRIARCTGGSLAALFAIALMVTGPFHYFYYMGSPRGGYAVTLALGLWVLYQSAIMAAAEFTGRKTGWIQWGAIGLAAGVGWWTNQLITAYLVAAAVMLAAGLRGKILRWEIIPAALAFVLGSLPLWLWNQAHGWSTFSFVHSIGGTDAQEGWRLLITERLPLLMDWSGLLQWFGPVLFLLAALNALHVTVGGCRSKEGQASPAVWVGSGLILFVVISVFIFIRSHFAGVSTVRYLLPLVPVWAVWTGLLAAHISRRVHPLSGIVLVSLLVLAQVPGLHKAWKFHQDAAPKWRAASELASRTRALGVDVLYGDIWQHWINFASGEQVMLCDIISEPYVPYEQMAECATNPAVFRFPGPVAHFAVRENLTYETTTVGEWQVAHSFKSHGPLYPANIQIQEPKALSDRNLESSYEVQQGDDSRESVVLKVQREQPAPIDGIMLFSIEGLYPSILRVEARVGQQWRPVCEVYCKPFFWSGYRWFYGGLSERLQIQFPERVMTSQLRLSWLNRKAEGVELSEVWLLKRGPAPETAMDPAFLKARGVTRLLADRGPSRALKNQWPDLEILEPSFMKKNIYSRQDKQKPEFPLIDWLDPGTAIWVDQEWAAMQREELAHIEEYMARYEGDYGTLWVATNYEHKVYAGLQWAGPVGLRLDEQRFALRHAHLLYQREKNRPSESIRRRVLAICPLYEPAMTEREKSFYAEKLYGSGPLINARFKPGVELVSVEVDRDRLKKGQSFDITYRWRCPPGFRSDAYAVFVHFKLGNEVVFQDDHVFMRDIHERAVREQLYNSIFTVSHTVTVPAHAPTGPYDCSIGLYKRKTGRRLKPFGSDYAAGDHVRLRLMGVEP